mgnify:FL=1
MKLITVLLPFALAAIISCSSTEDSNKSESIRINQVAFYPSQEKTLTLEPTNDSKKISIYKFGTEEKVWEGTALRTATSPWSGKERKVFDFSEITEPGTYTVKAGDESMNFTIDEHAYAELADEALLGFYHQRSGMDLDSTIAGQWARKGGHPDTEVLIHASAASESRPEGTVISSPKGWYDAGDYNKYVVNSGYSMGLMAEAFLMFPATQEAYDNYWDYSEATRKICEPAFEELSYNEQWMWTMQDPEDGGVYHKLTTPNFEGFIAPTECHQQRYVVQKSVTAALDFAGSLYSMARLHGYAALGCDIDAYKIYKVRFDKAEAAYAWAKAHPDAFYNQWELNATYDPDITTGAYGDNSADDEFFWAASSLYLATKKPEYLEDVKKYFPERFDLMTWGYVAPLGIFDWLQYEKFMKAEKVHYTGESYYDDAEDIYKYKEYTITEQEQEIIDRCKAMLLEYCDAAILDAEGSCYNSPYGNKPEDFRWGCASSFCDQAICFLYAYDITGDEKYLVNAHRNVNYILGQNATGYCYVTGFGSKSPMFPHSRLCHSDGIMEPIPGLLAGGPNPGHQDSAEVTYSSDYPDESYEDVMPSYASNEIAINWNASLVAAINWLKYEEGQRGSKSTE